MRRKCSDLVEDLATRSGCARSSSRRSRRTCRSAGSPTARRRRPSGGRRGSASAPPRPGGRRAVWKSALTVPSRGVGLVRERRASRTGRASASRARSAAGRFGHLVVAGGAAARAQRHTWRARKAGSPARRASRRAASRSTRVYGGSDDAPRQVPRPRRRRLAARRRAADLRRARDGRRRGRARPGARRRRRRRRSPSTARPVAAPSARVVYALNKPRRRRLDRARHARPPDGRRPRPGRGRLYPVGRLDADTTGLILLTNDGELAHRLTHPRFEVPKHLPRRVRRAAGARAGAARAARGRRARRRPHRAGAGARGSRPTVLEITIHEGRKRQVRRMCEAVGHPVESRSSASRFGPLRSGDLRAGGAPRASTRRRGGARCARPPARMRDAARRCG